MSFDCINAQWATSWLAGKLEGGLYTLKRNNTIGYINRLVEDLMICDSDGELMAILGRLPTAVDETNSKDEAFARLNGAIDCLEAFRHSPAPVSAHDRRTFAEYVERRHLLLTEFLILISFDAHPFEECLDPLPATQPGILRLPKCLLTAGKMKDFEDPCAICLEEYKIGELTTRLHCGHAYHMVCVAEWFTKSASCPYCTQKVDL